MAVNTLLAVATRVGTLVSNPFTVPMTAASCLTCDVSRSEHDTLSPDHPFKPKRAHFTLNIPAPDITDPSKSVLFGIQRQVGADWREEARIQYIGGTYTGMDGAPAQAPGLYLFGEEMAGSVIRAGLNIPTSMRVGVDLEVGA